MAGCYRKDFRRLTGPYDITRRVIIIIIITSLFREVGILSNTNNMSDIWSSMVKIKFLNYRQFVQYIHTCIQYEKVTINLPESTSTFEITNSI